MLVLLVGCENGNVISDNGNQNSEEIAETITAENEEYEYVTMSLLSRSGVEIKTYETIYKDGISYMLIDDLVDLYNRTSDYDQYVKKIDLTKLDQDILIVEYNPEMSYVYGIERKTNNNGWSVSESNVYDNLTKEIDITKTVYGKIEVDENYYVPINLLQYYIYKGNDNLYIVNENQIAISYVLWGVDESRPDVQLNTNIDYEKALKQTEELIDIKAPEIEIEDYTQYVIEKSRMMIEINDGHYNEFFDMYGDLLDFDRVYTAMDESLIDENELMVYRHNSSMNYETVVHENYLEVVDENTIYIRIEDFKDIDDLIRTFTYETKDFSKDRAYNITVDLRDNQGGDLTNGLEFIEMIGTGPFKFEMSLVNDGIKIDRTYVFEKDDENYMNYHIDVLVNEYTISCGVFVAGILVDSLGADIYGVKPTYDNLSKVVNVQFPDRSINMMSDLTSTFKSWDELGIEVQDMSEYNMIQLDDLEVVR